MTGSPGTGAGVGIALGLLVLLLAGPGAYYYRKKRRQRLGSKSADNLEDGVDYYGGIKPQLDDTSVSPETAWRISNSTVNDGPIPVSEAAGVERVPAHMTALGINPIHPTILRPSPTGVGTQELDVTNEGRRPELSADIPSPPPTELRAEKSPPVTSTAGRDTQALFDVPVTSQEAFARSDESIQLPTLPGPLLPPKQPGQTAQR